MTRIDPSRALAVAAGLVIIALTAAAFWLSYAHLAEVASAHGLQNSPVRAWAWPATLDLFIVAGELLMLRAALAKRVDWWAIGLTTVGSLGSIVLNVAGVTGARDPGAVPLLDYVVAAVPPTAALLAFGALMRQVHQALAGAERPHPAATDGHTPVKAAPLERTHAEGVDAGPVRVRIPAPAAALPALEPATAPAQVICGAGQVWRLSAPRPASEEEVRTDPGERLRAEAAATVLRACWSTRTPVADAARLATRSEAYVRKVFGRLDEERGEHPAPGQMALGLTGAGA